MKSFELYLAKKFITKALHCPCPPQIPRSGDAGALVNCFSIYIDKVGSPYLIVRGLSGDDVDCLEWSGNSFDKPVKVALGSIEAKDVSITHFYGHGEVQYSGVFDFVLGRTLFLPYVKIHVVRAITSIDQYFFNKKKFFARQRIELLRFLVQRKLEGLPITDPISLMTALYSIKWVCHPEQNSQLKRLNFYLDSLVDTGELRRGIENRYELTGEALRAIELYEEQERKHTENIKIQRRMFWLTLVVALLTGAQAGLFRMPTLLDLSDWKPGTSTPTKSIAASNSAPAAKP